MPRDSARLARQLKPNNHAGMKANWVKWVLLLLFGGAVFQWPDQQSEADRKLLADIRGESEKGDAQAQFELGEANWSGNFGVTRNYMEAVKWYRKAAEQGHPIAQNNLGVCYDRGEGVSKSFIEAA